MTIYDVAMIGRGDRGGSLGILEGNHLATGQHCLAGPRLFVLAHAFRPVGPALPGRAGRGAGVVHDCNLRSGLGSSLPGGLDRANDVEEASIRGLRPSPRDDAGGVEGTLLGMIVTLFVVSLAPQTRGPIFASPTGKLVGTVMETLGPVLPGEGAPGCSSRSGITPSPTPRRWPTAKPTSPRHGRNPRKRPV